MFAALANSDSDSDHEVTVQVDATQVNTAQMMPADSEQTISA